MLSQPGKGSLIMNKHIVKGGLAGVAVLALAAGGSTFAAWSDYDQINGNTTEAGHLKLDLDSTGAINNVGGQAIAPGEFRTIDFMVASADLDGVPNADLSMKVLNLADQDNGCGSTSSEQDVDPGCANPGDTGEFSQQGYVRIRYTNPAPESDVTFANNNCSAPSGYVNSVGYTPASDNDTEIYPKLNTLGGPLALGNLAGDEAVCVRVDLGLPPSATNMVQTDSSTFDLQFDLAQ
jgi:predicted ribosomally synthesized peptide with SipW-like signal peptide